MPSTVSQLTSAPSTLRWVAAGLLFALLWASAATATKIGLTSVQPLVLAELRFFLAATLMLTVAHGLSRRPLPTATQWRPLAIYGFLNISLYLGLYVVAMQHVTAGIGSLAIATNPIFISLLSSFLFKKKLTGQIIASLIICSTGVVCAAWPLLHSASVTSMGLVLLLGSMLCYSAATLYYASRSLKDLPLFVVNGWQTLFGGLFLLPAALIFYQPQRNHFSVNSWAAVGWLAVPVSVVAIQLWLWLLRTDAVKAGLWLFCCPVFGLAIAAWLIGDAIGIYTVVGVALVISGLGLAQKRKPQNQINMLSK